MPTFIDDQDKDLDPAPCATQTVLYVEDHPVNVILMQAMCAKRPQVRLVVANDGEEGIRLAKSEQPELLLLDLRLPDCHGVDLLRRMREIPELADVPAVAVTAEDTSALGGAGFLEIWHKPMDMHATLSRLDWLLAKPEIERSNAQAGVAHSTTSDWAWPAAAASRRTPPPPIPFPATPHRSAEPASQGSFDAAM